MIIIVIIIVLLLKIIRNCGRGLVELESHIMLLLLVTANTLIKAKIGLPARI